MRRTRAAEARITRTRLLLSSIAALLAAGACAREIQTGSGLQKFNARWGWETTSGLPPREEFTMLFVNLENVSSEPLRIVSVEPVGAKGIPEKVRMLKIELLPRGVRDNNTFPLGRYGTYPPTHWSKGRCKVAEMVRAEGHVIPPHAPPAVVAMVFRAVSPGTAGLQAVRVVYKAQEDLYQQMFPFTMRMEVREDAPVPKYSRAEKRCIGA